MTQKTAFANVRGSWQASKGSFWVCKGQSAQFERQSRQLQKEGGLKMTAGNSFDTVLRMLVGALQASMLLW